MQFLKTREAEYSEMRRQRRPCISEGPQQTLN